MAYLLTENTGFFHFLYCILWDKLIFSLFCTQNEMKAITLTLSKTYMGKDDLVSAWWGSLYFRAKKILMQPQMKWGQSHLTDASCKIQGLPCLFISVLTLLPLCSQSVQLWVILCPLANVQLADLCKQRHWSCRALLSRDSQKVVRVLDSLISFLTTKEKRSGSSKRGNYSCSSALFLKLSVKRAL